MGKKKTNPASEQVIHDEKLIEIRGATLKDDFCNYSYELKSNPTAGDTVKRSGASIVHNDLKVVFSKLKPHLAVICEMVDAFKIKDISDFENIAAEAQKLECEKNTDPEAEEKLIVLEKKFNALEKKVLLFFVTGFSLEGSGENESISLVGFKRLSTGEDLPLKTPKIKWEGSYSFIDELRVVTDDIIHEVEEYMNGKAAPKIVQAELFEEVKEEECA